ncbi:unnamed protein product, partial [Ectocarpus sp. 12 AP-2014]
WSTSSTRGAATQGALKRHPLVQPAARRRSSAIHTRSKTWSMFSASGATILGALRGRHLIQRKGGVLLSALEERHGQRRRQEVRPPRVHYVAVIRHRRRQESRVAPHWYTLFDNGLDDRLDGFPWRSGSAVGDTTGRTPPIESDEPAGEEHVPNGGEEGEGQGKGERESCSTGIRTTSKMGRVVVTSCAVPPREAAKSGRKQRGGAMRKRRRRRSRARTPGRRRTAATRQVGGVD